MLKLFNKRVFTVELYPFFSAGFALLLLFIVVGGLYLREEEKRRTLFLSVMGSEKKERLTLNYKNYIALIESFVLYNGEDLMKEVEEGSSLHSQGVVNLQKRIPSLVNSYAYDSEFNLLAQLKLDQVGGVRGKTRLQHLSVTSFKRESHKLEHIDQSFSSLEGVHALYFSLGGEGFLVFILSSEGSKNITYNSLVKTDVYTESFFHLSGSHTQEGGEYANRELIELMATEKEGIEKYRGNWLFFSKVSVGGASFYITVTLNEGSSIIEYFPILTVSTLIVLLVTLLLSWNLKERIKKELVGKEFLFEYEDQTVKELEKTIKYNLTNINRLIDFEMDARVLKEDLLSLKEGLAKRIKR